MTLVIIYILFLLLCSAFFSGSETALTGVSQTRVHKLKSEGDRRGILLGRLRDKKEQFIGAILLGNNLVNILASALATKIAIEWYGEEGVFIATIVMTLMVLIFSEVLPKTFAIQNTDKVALFVSPIFTILIYVFYPITFVVNKIVSFFLWLLRLNKVALDEIDGKEDLRGAIEMHHDEGDVVKDDKDMMASILDLSEREVKDGMIHRSEMVTINANDDVSEIIKKCANGAYTRVPVYEGKGDNIIGILHSRDLMRAIHNHGIDGIIDIRPILKEAWFVPENRKLKDQLDAFKRKQNHFALVVDEYGELLGLITMEDILEEIVGHIEDEHDKSRQDIRELKKGGYMIKGDVHIRDINRELDWDLPILDHESNTIAGLVINEAQVIPAEGQIFHYHKVMFKIIKKDKNKISLIQAEKIED